VAIINRMLKKLGDDVSCMQQGLQPESLAYWYDVLIRGARRSAPAHLQDKISVRQDPILPMKFNLSISRRAVMYFAESVDENLERMPYTTKLYFLKVREALDCEVDRSLV